MRGWIKPPAVRKPIIDLVVALCCLTSACQSSDLSKLHDALNKAAKALNGAAKTSHTLYESGAFGAVGSAHAIEIRQKAATIIHDKNENLITALNLAKQLNPETFDQGKLAILQALTAAAATVQTGNATIDLVLASVIALINEAVSLIALFKSSQLYYILPEIKTWKIERIAA